MVCKGNQTYFVSGCAIQQKVQCSRISLKDFVLYSLPKDSVLYRAGKIHTDRPEWYGPEKTAKRYGSAKTFTTKQELTLMYMSYENIRRLYEIISTQLSENDKKVFDAVVFTFSHNEINKYNQIKKETPSIHTLMNFRGFLTDDTHNYKALRLAKILCQYGIDGWIIQNDTVLQKADLFKNYSPIRNEEILICNPSSVLTKSP